MKEKILTIMIMLTLIMSMVIQTEAVPGHNADIGIAADELTYNPDDYIDASINASSLNVTDYYVLYPIYNANAITWSQLKAGGSPVKLTVNAYDDFIDLSTSIKLNVTGMWALSETGTYDGSTPIDFFYVNASECYEIDVTKTEVDYGSEETITITVTENGSAVECWIDLIREYDETPVFHRYEPDGKYKFTADMMQYTGNYTVQAYSDLDGHICGYYDDKGYYDYEYGKNLTKTNYNYTNCGPYDPPEKTAETKQIIMYPEEPDYSLDKDEVQWGFDDTINITLDEDFEDILNVKILNQDGKNETMWFDIVSTEEYITITNKATANATSGGWGRDDCGKPYGDNGTWQMYLFLDKDGDGKEEWNATVEFSVVSAEGVQWFWIDDDGTISTNNKDGSIPEIPDINEQPLAIQFQIIGNDYSYYGDGSTSPVEDFGENITISGASLFTGNLDEIPGVSYVNGTWTVLVTPIMKSSNRYITFDVDWEDYGTLTETLDVGGTEKNGTIVTLSPSTFVVDKDITLQVSVFGPLGDGYPLSNADVSLYWVNENGTHGVLINETSKPDTTGQNKYSFNFTTEDQKDGTPPCYIMAYVYVQNVGYGYAKTKMTPQSGLTVNVSVDTLMAGLKTEFDIDVKVGDDYPDESDGMTIEFYDEEGELVSLDSSFGSIRNTDVDEVSNTIKEYISIPGTYTIYAYNDTYDSTGHNATLVVKPVTVTCNKDPFIWNYDENISAKFTVKYNNELLDGTLKIYNMKNMGDYYRVWNDTGNNALSFNVDNGNVTIENITADVLPDGKQNLSFEFKPSGGGCGYGKVDSIVEIKVADVTASPKYVAYNTPVKVDILVEGRGNPLKDVNVTLEIPGLTAVEDITSPDGVAEFAFTPQATGTIKIFIENRESDEVIEIVSWSFDISVQSQVNEKTQFTITIKDDEGEPEEGVKVTFDGTNKNTGTDGKVSFNAPQVSSSSTYDIKASKDGFMPQTVSIKVNNVPELQIIAPDEVTAEQSFDVTIADDEGRAIVGANVRFGGNDYTSEAQGTVKLTAPAEARDYKITASFDDYVDTEISITVNAKPSTPGFELLSIVIALGVILIVRKKIKR